MNLTAQGPLSGDARSGLAFGQLAFALPGVGLFVTVRFLIFKLPAIKVAIPEWRCNTNMPW